MSNLNYVIIEDEYPAQQILLKHFEKFPEFECAGTFTDVLDDQLEEKLNAADLLLLDINLPSLDGLSFLKIKTPNMAIILTTAYSEYSLESYNYHNIIDYLLKPIRFERFFLAIEKFKKHRATLQMQVEKSEITKDQIFVKVEKEIRPIFLDHILYIESLKDYVQIHLVDSSIIHSRNLKYWEDCLPVGRFIRVHQSFIINPKKIERILSNDVVINKKFIPIGRKYKDAFEAYKNSLNVH